MDYVNEFKKIVAENIKRKGVSDLMEQLERTDFYTAPASTRFHDSEPQGLVKHSVEVYNYLKKYNNPNLDLTPEQNAERISIVSLFHDVCKIGMYKMEMRNTKDENGKWVQVPYYTIDNMFPYGHGEKSVYLLQKFMELTDEEAMAIRWHMGAYDGERIYNDLNEAQKMFPLTMYLHFADVLASNSK